jgi:hypothetical protein
MALTLNNSLSTLQAGQYVWCKYTASNDTVGTFSDIATKDDAQASAAGILNINPTNAPDGYFKLICVGEDYLGRKKMVADRVLQHSISWNTLNTGGITDTAKLIDLSLGSAFSASVRLLTGGIVITDKDNEWDKIIAESNLGGNITAGDNSIWNWSPAYTWTSTTTNGTVANRVIRGKTAAGAYSNIASSTVNTTTGFRPLILIESLLSNKYLIKDGNTLYTVVNGDVASIRTNSNSVPITESDFIDNGIDSLTGISNTTFNGLVTPKILYYKVV